MDINGIIEQQNLLQTKISRSLIGQITVLKEEKTVLEDLKVLPAEETARIELEKAEIEEKIAIIEEDFARSINREVDLEYVIDRIILKAQ